MHDSLDIRHRMAAAGSRIKRLKRIDRAAVSFITLGGIFVILCVIGILVFIAWQAVPLFRGARTALVANTRVDTRVAEGSTSRRLGALGVDEYQLHVYTIEPDAQVVFWNYRTGAREQSFPLPGLAGATVVSSSRSLMDDFIAAGTTDGRVGLAQVRLQPVFEQQTQTGLDIQVTERGVVDLDPGKRPIRDVAYREDDSRKTVAAVVGDNDIALWWTDDAGEERRATVRSGAGERFTCLRLGHATDLAAGTDTGKVYYWELEEAPILENVSKVGPAAITAITFASGDNTAIVGTAAGEISGWFRVRLTEESSERQARVRVHEFTNQGAAVTFLAASTRDKSFVSAGADGSLVLRHLTTQRTLAELPRQVAAATAAVVSPKNDGLVVALANGRLARFRVESPHPETTLRTLFGKVWYEGYAQPEYVWQSTGATDDFEAKLSLVPLIFGTIKGTVYALLFAVPLAVLGALYSSQFAHPNIRSKIKPTVEIMAALPSVVIGFIAGLWLAPVVDRNLVAVMFALPLMLASGTLGILVWKVLPRSITSRQRAGAELMLIVPLLLLGAWVAVLAAPWLEAALFNGDARLWLHSIGLTYDQRNCLVVGVAMGFAVIPIIFTISDDAFQSVPSSLTAASLALGASRWQTALHVVVPTASPGVFSAVMVGFGRAIGETMIVLMATGNTPLMDWSIFNGMRTMSANIAVEIPEAPVDGTLYRVLFLSAALLFVLTFAINTVAELIRQRLREKYRAA